MKPLITKAIFCGIVGVLIIAVAIVALISSNSSPVDTSTLELVAIVHRHGFRTPTDTYKSDPYQESSWPVTRGQLLKKGKQQLYKLGETFRKRYQSYITNYSAESVKVRTSDLDRCHMSVAALLAAWFPPQSEYELWSKELKWQPIPIHSVPYSDDNMLAQNKTCPKYNLELKKVREEIKANETADDDEFYRYLTENMGENIFSIRQVETFYTTLNIEKLYGFTIPEWTKKVYPDIMEKKARLSVAAFQWTKTMKRLSAGPFIYELVGQFVRKTRGESNNLKLLLYSAHDSTLTSIWQSLEFEGIIMPDFGSSFTFELHKINGKFVVKMFYLKNTEDTEPLELKIPSCSTPCLLDTFIKTTEAVRPDDWDKECAI